MTTLSQSPELGMRQRTGEGRQTRPRMSEVLMPPNAKLFVMTMDVRVARGVRLLSDVRNVESETRGMAVRRS
jgi:hypothetical protein